MQGTKDDSAWTPSQDNIELHTELVVEKRNTKWRKITWRDLRISQTNQQLLACILPNPDLSSHQDGLMRKLLQWTIAA